MTETRTAYFELPQYSVDADAALSRTDSNEAFGNLENRAAYDDGSTGAALPVTLLKPGRYYRQSFSDGYALHRRGASAWEWVGGTVMPLRRLYRGGASGDIAWSTDVNGAAPNATMTYGGDLATSGPVRSLLASAGADLTTTLDPTSTGRSYVRTRADGERGLVLAAHGAGAAALLTVREAGGGDTFYVDAQGRLRTTVPAGLGQAGPVTGVPLSAAATVGTAGSAARLHGSTSAPVTSGLQVFRSLGDATPILDALPDHVTLGRSTWTGGQLSLLAPTLDSAGAWAHTGDLDVSGAVTAFGGRVVMSVDDLSDVLDPTVDDLVHLKPDNMLYRRLSSSWLGVAHLSDEGHARYTNLASQTIPSNTPRKIYLPSTISSTDDVTPTVGDATTGSYFTLNRAGRWMLDGGAEWAAVLGSTFRSIFIADDTNTVQWRASTGYNKEALLTLSTEVTRRFAAGQRVALWGYHERGADLNVTKDTEVTSFSLTWLGP